MLSKLLSCSLAFVLVLACAWPRVAVAHEPVPDASAPDWPVSQAPGNKSPYEIWWGFDIGFTLGLTALAALPRMYADEIIVPPCVPPGAESPPPTGAQTWCDADELNALDRLVAGWTDPTASELSDIGFFVNIFGPVAFDALDVLINDPADGWLGFAKDAVILAETLAVASAVNNTFNFIIRRPRPLVYNESRGFEGRIDGNQYLSFPSGHVLVAFAMATAYSWTFTERHPDHWLVAPVWVTTYGLALSAGIGRIYAGEHFPTDVIVGGLVGVGVGLMIPWLHTPDDEFDTDILVPGDRESADIDVSFSPMLLDEGFGASVTIR